MSDPNTTYFWLIVSAFAAGVVNAVAGGGTLLTFPSLMELGRLSSVMANGTSTVALLPGSLAGAAGYRREFATVRRWALLLAGPSLIGGVIGTLLVIWFPDAFDRLVPWLILTAAVLFLLQPTLTRLTGLGKSQSKPSPRTEGFIVACQVLIAIYGGYFGAGIGILMITSLSLMGTGDIHRTNALKTFLAACINATSAAAWIIGGKVEWNYALSMMASAIAGGYLGARVARLMPKNVVRWIVVAIGFGLAAYYFWKQFAVGRE